MVYKHMVLNQRGRAQGTIFEWKTGEVYLYKSYMSMFLCAPVLSSVSVWPSQWELSSIYRQDTHMCHSPERERERGGEV